MALGVVFPAPPPLPGPAHTTAFLSGAGCGPDPQARAPGSAPESLLVPPSACGTAEGPTANLQDQGLHPGRESSSSLVTTSRLGAERTGRAG